MSLLLQSLLVPYAVLYLLVQESTSTSTVDYYSTVVAELQFVAYTDAIRELVSIDHQTSLPSQRGIFYTPDS